MLWDGLSYPGAISDAPKGKKIHLPHKAACLQGVPGRTFDTYPFLTFQERFLLKHSGIKILIYQGRVKLVKLLYKILFNKSSL